MHAETSTDPRTTAKGTPHRADGAASREDAHRRHRRHCRRPIRVAQHAILSRLMLVDEVASPDFDDLPPAASGRRCYVGTAFLDLRRDGLIRAIGGPVMRTAGGRHSNYLHRWRLAADGARVAAWLDSHPIPEPDPVDEPEVGS